MMTCSSFGRICGTPCFAASLTAALPPMCIPCVAGSAPIRTGEFLPGFAAEIDGRWRAKHSSTRMFANELYVTLLRKAPSVGVRGVKSWIDRLSHRANRTEAQVALRLAQKELQAISQRFLASLEDYRPRLLGLVRRDGWTYSEPARFLGRLINLEDRPVLLPKMDLSKYLPWRRIYFGRDALEVAGSPSAAPKLAAIVSIKEYGPETYAGLLDRFLQIPRELVITQSFVFEDRQAALSRMQMQQRRMVQTEDVAASQVGEIDQALDDAMSGHIAFGHHHLTVLCVEQSLADLDKAVADVEAALVDIGIVSVREDLNLEASFWAQLPGNFPYIARRALISTANFAGFASLHNYPRRNAIRQPLGTRGDAARNRIRARPTSSTGTAARRVTRWLSARPVRARASP